MVICPHCKEDVGDIDDNQAPFDIIHHDNETVEMYMCTNSKCECDIYIHSIYKDGEL